MRLAVLAYLLVAVAIVAGASEDRALVAFALLVGAPAVMLLGAGLTNAALGSRIDAVVVGIAFGVGMPVASVTSFVIAAWIVDGFALGTPDLAGTILRRGVSEAIAAAPAVALAATLWVVAVRRWAGEPVRPLDQADPADPIDPADTTAAPDDDRPSG
jgi:hypothetical protein